MGVDFSGFIKLYLHKFNEEIQVQLKDKTLEEKELIFLDKITSLFLSKYIIIICSEKNLNPYYYFVNLCQSINKNTFLKIYFPLLDNLIDNKFVEKISQFNEKNDEILPLMNSLTEEFKDMNIKDLDMEKFERNLYTNIDSNINEFYATIFKEGINLLTEEKQSLKNTLNNIIKSSEILNIDEKKIIINGIIEPKNIKKSNFIQQILILVLVRKKINDIQKVNELKKNEKTSDLIEILEKIKVKDNEMQKETFEFIINEILSKQDFMNIDDLIKYYKNI